MLQQKYSYCITTHKEKENKFKKSKKDQSVIELFCYSLEYKVFDLFSLISSVTHDSEINKFKFKNTKIVIFEFFPLKYLYLLKLMC
jgi:hypothetical protein